MLGSGVDLLLASGEWLVIVAMIVSWSHHGANPDPRDLKL